MSAQAPYSLALSPRGRYASAQRAFAKFPTGDPCEYTDNCIFACNGFTARGSGDDYL